MMWVNSVCELCKNIENLDVYMILEFLDEIVGCVIVIC